MVARIRAEGRLPPLPAVAYVRPPHAARDRHCGSYTPEAAAAVAAVYKDDIAAFGYVCDCPVCAIPPL